MSIPIIQPKRAIEIQNGPHAGQTHEFDEPVGAYVGLPLPEWNDGRGVWVAIYRVSPLGGRAEFYAVELHVPAPVDESNQSNASIKE